MKKSTLRLVLMFTALLLASCVKKEYITIESTPEEPKDESTYTIMMYGCGGGDLDYFMATNIQEALLTGATDRGKFTGQIKFSQAYQQYKAEGAAGTQRFIVGSEPISWYWPEEELSSDLALYDPQTLTNFINWSKEKCPADEYILLLWNHGGAWAPYDDGGVEPVLGSRGVIYDDVMDGQPGLSLNALVKGIQNSGTKMKMIYYDACLMGMVEILSELTDCADYVLGASHITPGMGGDYDSLIYNLNNSTNFEQAIENYSKETMAHWNGSGMPLDLMLVDLSKMDQLLSVVKDFSTILAEVGEIANENKERIENEDENIDLNDAFLTLIFQEAINSIYWYDSSIVADDAGLTFRPYPYFDLLNFAEVLAATNYPSTYNSKFISIASRLNRAFNEAIVFKALSNNLYGMNLSMGVAITDATVWNKYGWNQAYPSLKFDQATGWSNWVSENKFTPTGNPNPDSFTNSSESEPENGDEGEGEGEGEGDDSYGDEEGDDSYGDEEGGELSQQDLIFIQLVLQIISTRN